MDLLGAVAGVGWWRVLDDLLYLERAARATPDVLAWLFESVGAQADADGVGAARVERVVDSLEVGEHVVVVFEVADGVDGVESERETPVGREAVCVEGAHVGDAKAVQARIGGAHARACILDHGFGEVEGGDAHALGECGSDVSAAAAGWFEPWAGGFEAEAVAEVSQAADFLGGALVVEDVVEHWLVVESLCDHGRG